MLSFLKKVGAFALLGLLWCFPLINRYENYIFIIITCCILSCVCQLSVKNRYLALLISVVAMIPAMILRNEYVFLAACPLFIFNEYTDIFNRKKVNRKENKSSILYLGVNISVFMGLAALIYHFNFSEYNKNYSSAYSESHTIIWVMLFICLMLAAISLSKKTTWKQISVKCNINMDSLKKIRFIHLANAICFIETMLLFYFMNNQSMYSERLFFFPWIAYFGAMIYYDDPIFKYALNKVENIFKKYAAKTQ